VTIPPGEAVFELRILGPFQLSAPDGRAVEPLVRQSKRTALLAYLAAAKPHGAQRRDKLLALFWPESDEAHARAALSQALYALRRALGERAIVSQGEAEVGLNGDLVWCDATAFEAALDAGRPAEALALYRGDLLDGFFVSGALEFERWLDQERARMRQRAADGAWALAEAKAADGDAIEAARWARRAADLLPADEAAVRRLMTFLHGLGDRTAAIRAYEAFSWRLAQEYELEPSAETEALAAAIRRTDDRVVASPTLPPPLAEKAPTRAPAAPPRSKAVAIARRAPRTARLAIPSFVILALAIIAWASQRQWERPPRGVARFALELEGALPITAATGSTLALSPNGKHLVYVGDGGEGPQLFLRPMDRLETAPIPGTRGAGHLFFSPDGEWVGFVAGNTIRKVRLAGGPPVTICNITSAVPGASWGPDDMIVFATLAGLWRVPAAGGQPMILAAADTARGERYRWPHVLPNGRATLFTRVSQGGFQLAVVSLETGAVSDLGLEGTGPRYVPPGYLVFARMDGVLLATPFDARTLRPTGTAVPIAEGVFVGNAGAGKVSFSRAGALAYVPDLPDGPLVIVDRAGRGTTLPGTPRGIGGVRFSPDGRRLAIAVRPPGGEHPDIWVLDLVANSLRRVTFDSGAAGPAPWSPDGRRIAFASKPGGRNVGFILRWMAVDAGDTAETLLAGEPRQIPDAFTPDGRALLFQRWNPHTQGDLWVLPLDGRRTPRPYLRGPADERSSTLSADGRWLAYVSDESGRDEVYVRPFLANGPPVQISRGGGGQPRWAPSGREFFYRGPEGMVAAAVRTASPLTVDSRTVLFDDRPYVSWRIGAAYDVHPDGHRFVMIRRGSHGRDVIVVLNWLDQLRSQRR
jgi:DNA-binding SARP family transcriptional activator/Tol biopolymer transport system component